MGLPLASLFASPLAGAVLYALLFLGLAWLASRTVRLLVDRAIRRDHRGIIDRTAGRFVVQVVRFVAYLLAVTAYFRVIPGLRAFGGVLLAGVSVTSVVFGLAASSTLGNLIAGVSLLVYFPYRVGDRLRLPVAGVTQIATIEGINLGYTQLRSEAGETLIVPNSVLIGTAVGLQAAAPPGPGAGRP